MSVKLERVRWQMTWSAVIEARGWLPTFEDYALYAEFNTLECLRETFEKYRTNRSFPFLETRCVVVAVPVAGDKPP
jgi:hypothetical protein